MTDWERSDLPRTDSGVVVFLQVGAGIVLVFTLHAVVGGLLFGFARVAQEVLDPSSPITGLGQMATLVWMAGISCVQFLYVLPVGIALWFVRRPLALGVLIGAGLTMLLQGSCYALFIGAVGILGS